MPRWKGGDYPLVRKRIRIPLNIPAPKNRSYNLSAFGVFCNELVFGGSINDECFVAACFYPLVDSNFPLRHRHPKRLNLLVYPALYVTQDDPTAAALKGTYRTMLPNIIAP